MPMEQTAIHPRTRGREIALQYLYMHDILKGEDVQLLSDHLGGCSPKPDGETAQFTRLLVESVLGHQQELDREIAESRTNWSLNRMATVDRNILRLGIAEMISCPETPYKVILNEAIEMARRYSSEQACSFVNGVLDQIRAKLRPEEPPVSPLELPLPTAEPLHPETPVAPEPCAP